MRAIGFALAIAGAWLVLHSVGTVNGGFIVGAPLAVWGVHLLTRKERSDEQETRGSTHEN